MFLKRRVNVTSRDDDFVCLNLGIITGKSDIKDVFPLTFFKSNANVEFEVVHFKQNFSETILAS